MFGVLLTGSPGRWGRLRLGYVDLPGTRKRLSRIPGWLNGRARSSGAYSTETLLVRSLSRIQTCPGAMTTGTPSASRKVVGASSVGRSQVIL